VMIFRVYLRYLGRNHLGRSAIQLRFSALRTFYKYLIRHGAMAVSPIKNLSLPKIGKRLPKFLTAQQMKDLLEAPCKLVPSDTSNLKYAELLLASRRDIAVLETIYSCGLRISELCGLQAADIEWNERLVRVRGKGKKERLLPIGETALDAIRKYWELLAQPPAGIAPVFTANRARRTPVFGAAVATAIEETFGNSGSGPEFDTTQIKA